MNTARNIIAIDRIQVNGLDGFRRINASSVQVSSSTIWKSIPIRVPARLTISEKIEEGVRMHTAQLVFHTCEELEDCERQVYRCKTAEGKFYLIGTDSRPYPVTTIGKPHPDNMTDSQLDEVTVSYASNSKIPYIQ